MARCDGNRLYSCYEIMRCMEKDERASGSKGRFICARCPDRLHRVSSSSLSTGHGIYLCSCRLQISPGGVCGFSVRDHIGLLAKQRRCLQK